MLRRRFMMISGPGPTPPGPDYPTDGLVHELTFDNGDLTDTGSSPTTATPTNIVGYPAGKVGKCLSLDRTSQVAVNIVLRTNANTDCRTFSLWFKRGTGYAATGNFQVARNGNSTYVQITASQIRVNQSSSVYSTFSGGVATNDTNWHHLVLVVATVSDSNCTVECWLDGTKLTATRSNNHTTNTLVNSTLRYLGSTVASSSQNDGYYDQWRIYNRVLTDAEIAQLYNSGQGV